LGSPFAGELLRRIVLVIFNSSTPILFLRLSSFPLLLYWSVTSD
jgi:hypothetical protein